jgi:hypothetical protein
MRLAIDNIQLQEMFVSTESADCNLIFASLGSISYNLNEMVENLKSYRPDTKEFRETKLRAEFHSLRAWLLAKEVRESCQSGILPILFIYTDSPESEKQDLVLNEIKASNDHVLVYSIDIDSDQPALNLIKDAYGVDSAPALIINNKNAGKLDKSELSALL